jgi:hypothetical protein
VEVHSTAAENAVTRTDKFGHSMPILRPAPRHDPIPGMYYVEHEGITAGLLQDFGEGHTHPRYAAHRLRDDRNAPGEVTLHPDKHSAISHLFSPIDPATYGDRHR